VGGTGKGIGTFITTHKNILITSSVFLSLEFNSYWPQIAVMQLIFIPTSKFIDWKDDDIHSV
jgi:hypothetical protein